MLLFLILLSVPIIEIALFVTVGDRIGLMPTLAIVILTALIGASALRMQGFAVLQRAQSFSRPEEISDVLIDGLFLMASGLLLLTPGFLTDTIGFLLLIPPLRRALARWIGRRAVKHMVFASGSMGAPPPGPGAAGPRPGADPRGPTGFKRGDEASPWSQPPASEPNRDEADDAVVLEQSPPARRGDDAS